MGPPASSAPVLDWTEEPQGGPSRGIRGQAGDESEGRDCQDRNLQVLSLWQVIQSVREYCRSAFAREASAAI